MKTFLALTCSVITALMSLLACSADTVTGLSRMGEHGGNGGVGSGSGGVAGAGGSDSCAAGYATCGGVCVATGTDNANCGACGVVCAPGSSCTSGACLCLNGQLSCGSGCVDSTTDVANCGACANQCASGQQCSAGQCTCQSGLTACNGACVDTTSDGANCGGCGTQCPSGQVCSASRCATSCGAGETPCGSECANLSTSLQHCGQCNTACAAGLLCIAGACGCSGTATLCSGQCRDTSTDNANCGACGTTCSGGQSCRSGNCACPTNTTLCSGVCVNTSTDGANCGGCGRACGSGQTCAGGSCTCGSGLTDCSGQCKNLTNDTSNCGACGRTCSSGQTCTSGSCTGGTTTLCNFASGLNVAWVRFGNDVPNPNLTTFRTIFQNTYNSGGRIIRWWFHTNGTVTPGYDSNGMSLRVQQSHIDGVKAILAAADTAGVAVNISLWSFDMLQTNAGNAHTNNQRLLEVDANRQAYIDNYLTPLVTALRGTAGLYSYEIFNEPEGMGPNGWATYRTTLPAIQKTVNWLAAAIHTADPTAWVTNGAQTFNTCSNNITGKSNLYSDTALRNAGGRQNGTLDYYQVHYYSSNGTSNSPFGRQASYWGLDKKLVIGEFAPIDTGSVAKNNLYTQLYTDGYNGAWAWSYDADWVWPAMQTPMQNLYNAHSDVGNCP